MAGEHLMMGDVALDDPGGRRMMAVMRHEDYYDEDGVFVPSRALAEVERLRGERREADYLASGFERLAYQRSAEIERLREALEPFVAAYEAIDFLHCPDFRGPLDLAFFDHARKVLRG